jgi:hypothetical protein
MRLRNGTRVPRNTGTPPWIFGFRWTTDVLAMAALLYHVDAPALHRNTLGGGGVPAALQV